MKKYIVILSVLSLIAALIFSYFYSMILTKDYRASRAESIGMKYMAKVYTEYTVIGKTCQGEDTDENTYVSCSFRIKNAENTERTVRLQCPNIWKSFTGSSCKESLSIPENLIGQ
jgi:hypothetical protein